LFSKYKLRAKGLITGRVFSYFVLIMTAFLLSLLCLGAVCLLALSAFHPFVSSLFNMADSAPLYPVLYYSIGFGAVICLAFLQTYTRYVTDKIFFLKASDSSTKGAYRIKGKTLLPKSFLLGVLIITLKTLWFLVLQIPFLALASYFAYLLFKGLPRNIIYVFVTGCLVLFVIGLFFWFCIVQRYAAARYFFVARKNPSAFGSIKQSTDTMRGRSLKTAVFKLSMLPWIATCLAVIPIPYVLTYCKMSSAVLINEFMCRLKAKPGPAIVLGVK